jgi:hypothetical protein
MLRKGSGSMTDLSNLRSQDLAATGNFSRDQQSRARASVQGTSALSSSVQGNDADPLSSEAAQQATRRAARLNASKASDEEVASLLAERQQLLDKYFAGTITKGESTRLEYVRWSLDRIEDARHGAALDTLESHVARFEDLAEQLDALREQLGRAALNPLRQRRGR